MALTKEKKAQILEELTNSFKEAKSIVFTSYKGITVKEVTTLRQNFQKEGASYLVAKKTLIMLAAENAGCQIPAEVLDGPVAVSFSPTDSITAPKIAYKASKDLDPVNILGGVVDGEIMTIAQLKQLAQLPSKSELIAKMLGSMSAPISGFVRSCKSPIQGFYQVLQGLKDKAPAA